MLATQTVDQKYALIKQVCGFDEEPHILNGILSRIPPEWANNFDTYDIITLVIMLQKYRPREGVLKCFT